MMSWALAYILVKKASVHLGNYLTSLIVLLMGVLPMAAVVLITGSSWPGAYSVALSILAGVFLCAGFILAYKSLETEQLTSVVALGEIQPAMLTLFGVFVLKESVSIIAAASIILIFAGALLIITTEGLRINKKLIPAILSNVCWLIYWLIITEAVISSSTYAFQVMASRAAGLILILAMFILVPSKTASTTKIQKLEGIFPIAIILALLSGIFDGTGDTLFTLTVHSNLVVLGGALTALNPLFISVLSYFIYKDRLTRTQAIGFGIMVAGAVALSVL